LQTIKQKTKILKRKENKLN